MPLTMTKATIAWRPDGDTDNTNASWSTFTSAPATITETTAGDYELGWAHFEADDTEPSAFTWGGGTVAVVAAALGTLTGSAEGVAVAAGADLVVTVTAPAEYVGEYTITGGVAALAAGPVEVVPAVANAPVGDNLSVTPGLWISTSPPLETTAEWRVGSTVVATGSTYTKTPGELSAITYREAAGDLVGSTVGTLIEAQAARFPNIIRPANMRVLSVSPTKNTGEYTIAFRAKFNAYETLGRFMFCGGSQPSAVRNWDNKLVVYSFPGDSGRKYEFVPPNPPSEYLSFIMSGSVSGALPGGANVAVWVNGNSFTSTLTGISNANFNFLELTTTSDIYEFLLLDATEAKDPAILAPLLFDSADNWNSKNVIYDLPMGPWSYIIGGTPSNWTAGANLGSDPTFTFPALATPVTDNTP